MVTQPERFQISSQDLMNGLQTVQSGGLLRDAVFFQQILALVAQGKVVVVSDVAIATLNSLSIISADRSQLDQFMTQIEIYTIDEVITQKAQQIQSQQAAYSISITDAIDWAIHEQLYSNWIVVATDRRALPNAELISTFLRDARSNPEVNRSQEKTDQPLHTAEINSWEQLLTARLDAQTFNQNPLVYNPNNDRVRLYQQSCIGLAIGIALSEKFLPIAHLDTPAQSTPFNLQQLVQDAIGSHPLGMMIQVLNAESTGKFKLEIAGVVVMVQIDGDRQSPGKSSILQDVARITQQSIQNSIPRSTSLTESTAFITNSPNSTFHYSSLNAFPFSSNSSTLPIWLKTPNITLLGDLEIPKSTSNPLMIDYQSLIKQPIETDPIFPIFPIPDMSPKFNDTVPQQFKPWATVTDWSPISDPAIVGDVSGKGGGHTTSYTIESHWIFTSSHDETITTGAGNYFIAAGTGNNEIDSGEGVDLFVLEEGEGTTTIVQYQEYDRLGLLGALTYGDLDITTINSNAVEIRVKATQDILAIIEGITPDQLTQDHFLNVNYLKESSDTIPKNTKNLLPTVQPSHGKTQPIVDWVHLYQPGHSQLEIPASLWMQQNPVNPPFI
jgi:hypothetical protein